MRPVLHIVKWMSRSALPVFGAIMALTMYVFVSQFRQTPAFCLKKMMKLFSPSWEIYPFGKDKLLIGRRGCLWNCPCQVMSTMQQQQQQQQKSPLLMKSKVKDSWKISWMHCCEYFSSPFNLRHVYSLLQHFPELCKNKCCRFSTFQFTSVVFYFMFSFSFLSFCFVLSCAFLSPSTLLVWISGVDEKLRCVVHENCCHLHSF